MTAQIVVSIISLIGVIITGVTTVLTVSSKLAISQAVQDEKMKTIDEQLRKVVTASEEIPVMKYQIEQLMKQVKKLEEHK